MALSKNKPIPMAPQFAKKGKPDECAYLPMTADDAKGRWPDAMADGLRGVAMVAEGNKLIAAASEVIAADYEKTLELDATKCHVIVSFRYGTPELPVSYTVAKGPAGSRSAVSKVEAAKTLFGKIFTSK